MKFHNEMLVLALALNVSAPSSLVSSFSFGPSSSSSSSSSKSKSAAFNSFAHVSSKSSLTRISSSSRLFMDLNNDNKKAFFIDPAGPGGVADVGTEEGTTGAAGITETKETVVSASTLDVDVSKLLAEAKALKERAEKERLEAERLATILILQKISSLEQKLAKVESSDKTDEKTKVKQQLEIQEQINAFRKQMEPPSASASASASSAKTIDASSSSPLVSSKRTTTGTESITESATAPTAIPERKMPQDLYEKRIDAYKKFTPTVKKLFARAVQVEEYEDGETIIRKCYNVEMKRKSDGNIAPMDIMDIANAQAGFETLPPPVQDMVVESVGMKPGGSESMNHTAVVEKLVLQKKVKRTMDGGVEFSMEDSYDDDDSRSVRDREFTEEEVNSAIGLYENLPGPMKTMLAKSVGEEVGSNSTVIVAKMIEEKKLLPSEDGVEFVVFGNGEESDMMLEDIEAVNYVKALLPAVTRKEDQAPSEEEAMSFFREVLGKNTFNPTNKPESIPGGWVVKGDNSMENGDALVKALDSKLKESSVADKLNYYFMKDPSLVTKERYESDDFENPVLVITGPDISPDTNRFVKPSVTALAGLALASFSVATCLSTDLKMDVEMVETMTTPLVFSILGTQIAHEAAHQIVALKDKVRRCSV